MDDVTRSAAQRPAEQGKQDVRGNCHEWTARQSLCGAHNPARVRVQSPPPTCLFAWGYRSRCSNAGIPAASGGPPKRGCKPGPMRGGGPAAANTPRVAAARSGTPSTSLPAPRQGAVIEGATPPVTIANVCEARRAGRQD